MALTLDTVPSTMKKHQGVFSIIVSGQVTSPTKTNISCVNGSASLVARNVHDQGAGVYELVFSVPEDLPLQCNTTTGYTWDVTVSAETVTSSAVTLHPAPGWAFTELTSPTTTSSALTGYTGTTAVTGDHIEYYKYSIPEGLLVNMNADSTFTFTGTDNLANTFKRRVVKTDGTTGTGQTLSVTGNTLAVTVADVNVAPPDPIPNSPVITGTCNVTGTTIDVDINSGDTRKVFSTESTWSAYTDPKSVPLTRLPTSTNYEWQGDVTFLPNGNVLLVYSEGDGHRGNDRILKGRISTDGGKTYGAAFTIAASGAIDARQPFVYLSDVDDTLTMFYATETSDGATVGSILQQDVVYIRSTAADPTTWSAETSVYSEFPEAGLLNGERRVVPFGKAIKTSNGIAQCFWSYDQAYFLFSSDEGATWGNRTKVFDRDQTSTFYSEFYPIRIDDDRAIALVRKQDNAEIVAIGMSDDGCQTFSYLEDTTIVSGTAPDSPSSPSGMTVGNNTYFTIGVRRPYAKIWLGKAMKDHFYYEASTIIVEDSGYHTAMRYSSYADSPTPGSIDFGMSMLSEIPNVDYTVYVAWYEPKSSTQTESAQLYYSTAPYGW